MRRSAKRRALADGVELRREWTIAIGKDWGETLIFSARPGVSGERPQPSGDRHEIRCLG
jgi:hypothetical protein